uniref:Uncharacterized protein n=2 Tax=Alexandrium monilatum TaxID=311494 RepID=A0A7S4Q3L6_9DINO
MATFKEPLKATRRLGQPRRPPQVSDSCRKAPCRQRQLWVLSSALLASAAVNCFAAAPWARAPAEWRAGARRPLQHIAGDAVATPRARLRAAAPNFGDLMGAMPKVMEGMKKLPELQKKLREMPSSGTAFDGRVKITLTGDLAPQGVEIDQSLLSEVSSEELSAGVLEAMKEAHAASVELTRSSLAKFYGEMGVPVPPNMAGAGSAGAAAPSVPSPPKQEEGMAFDPAGLGGKTQIID